MGYYTYFNLEVLNEEEFTTDEIAKASHRLAEIMGEPNPLTLEYDDFNWLSYDDRKWYDHDKHMIILANEFPNMLFKLHGDGEEAGDSWNEYYCGTRRHCQGWHWDQAPQWTQYKHNKTEVLT